MEHNRFENVHLNKPKTKLKMWNNIHLNDDTKVDMFGRHGQQHL